MSALTISEDEEKRLKRIGFLNNRDTDCFSARVITRNGRLSASQMHSLAEAAGLFGNGTLIMTARLSVEVQGIPYNRIEPFREYMKSNGLETGGTGAKVRPIVSCKGSTCHYGLLDAYSLAEALHNAFFTGYHDVVLPHKFKIAVGGCPNNCAKPTLNDLGITGQRIPDHQPEKCQNCRDCGVVNTCPTRAAKIKNQRLEINTDKCVHCGRCIGKCRFDVINGYTDGYKIFIGGRWGKKQAQGRPLNRLFTDQAEVIKTVEKTILFFREQGLPGERFATTINRIGYPVVESQILSDKILERKEEILAIDCDEAINLVRC